MSVQSVENLFVGHFVVRRIHEEDRRERRERFDFAEGESRLPLVPGERPAGPELATAADGSFRFAVRKRNARLVEDAGRKFPAGFAAYGSAQSVSEVVGYVRSEKKPPENLQIHFEEVDRAFQHRSKRKRRVGKVQLAICGDHPAAPFPGEC